MTANEIQTWRRELADRAKLTGCSDWQAEGVQALTEIAYQLAVANEWPEVEQARERQRVMDKWRAPFDLNVLMT